MKSPCEALIETALAHCRRGAASKPPGPISIEDGAVLGGPVGSDGEERGGSGSRACLRVLGASAAQRGFCHLLTISRAASGLERVALCRDLSLCHSSNRGARCSIGQALCAPGAAAWFKKSRLMLRCLWWRGGVWLLGSLSCPALQVESPQAGQGCAVPLGPRPEEGGLFFTTRNINTTSNKTIKPASITR